MRNALVIVLTSAVHLCFAIGTAWWIDNALTWPWNAPAIVVVLPLVGVSWVYTLKWFDRKIPR